MASLFAARRQNLAASHSLHAYAKSVRLRASPFSRLICSLWQSNPPLFPIPNYVPRTFDVSVGAFHPQGSHKRNATNQLPSTGRGLL
jgi:hypothetical protein